MKLVIGSRGSKLALVQTEWVVEKLKEYNPDAEFEVKVIKTKGDKIQNVELDKIGDRGLFVKEIEEALLNHEIDMAIHSMKDIPSFFPKGLKLAASPEREDYRDALILKEGLRSLEDVPYGGRIGTGSSRRKFQLLKLRPDLNIVPIRGNIDTRMRKIEGMELHGIVLAAAGVKRLGLEHRISQYFDMEDILPAPTQGILAVEIREGESDLEEIISKIKDTDTELQVKAERAFLNGINGSCHTPMGALCIVKDENVTVYGMLGTENGEVLVKKSIGGPAKEAEALGRELAGIVLEEMKKVER
ncbi:MAG: hydroxymethylbilane synthase [Bacillota bacterium]|nr:hydroxymethylbilane synthase [Bacillota bacterium]